MRRSLLLRPRNVFLRNPALDVPPSYAASPSQVAAGRAADRADGRSALAFAAKGGAE